MSSAVHFIIARQVWKNTGKPVIVQRGYNITQQVLCEQDPCLARLRTLHHHSVHRRYSVRGCWIETESQTLSVHDENRVKKNWTRKSSLLYLHRSPHGREAKERRRKVPHLDTVKYKRVGNIMLQKNFNKVIVHWEMIWNTEWVISETIVMLLYGFQMNTKSSN